MPPSPARPRPRPAPHGPPPAAARSSTSGSGGILAALCLLLVAYTNPSLLGLAFLLAFLAWGSLCLPTPTTTAAAQRLWAAVSGLSALALLAQCMLQAAFLLGVPGGLGVRMFSLLGFPQPRGLADALLAVVPLLLALMASAAQVQAARDSSRQHARLHAEGMELQPLARSPQRAAPGVQVPTGACVAAVALLAAALAQPSVLAGPYMLAAAGAAWRFAGGDGISNGGGGSGLKALLRPWTAAYLLALYLWQALSGWDVLQPAARVLGLFSLSSAAAQGWQQLVPAAVQLGAMLLLFLAAGTLTRGESSARSRRGAGPSAERAGSERSPLLQHDAQQPRPQPQPEAPTVEPPLPRMPSAGAGPLVSAQQLAYTLLLDTAEALCRQPAVVAALLCCTALVRPSALGGGLLLWGLAALLAQPAARALQSWSRALTAALLVWQLSCYGASVAATVISIPAAAQAAGLQPSEVPWPLLALFAAAAATASLAWSSRQPQGPAALQPLALPPRLEQLLARISNRRHVSGGSSLPTSPTSAGASSEAAAAPWLVAWHLLLQAIFYAGLAAVPAAVFAVGTVCYDVLHGAYLAGLLVQLLSHTLRLKPLLAEAVLGRQRHLLLRGYASVHLAAVFAAYVGGLPGMGGALQPAELQQPLSIVGLWDPTVAVGMMPTLGLLLLATLHSSIDRAVHSGPQQQHFSVVAGVATSAGVAGVVYLCRLAVAYGPGLIALLGYCLVLFDCDLSLVGLALLLLLAATLTCQPPRGRWQDPGGSTALQAVMLGDARRSGTSGARLLGSPASRWLPLLLLAAFEAADFAAQAALPAVAAAAAAGWLPVPLDALDWVQTVVGLSPQAHGLELALRLLRPLALLAAVAAYRCCYCLGTLHRQLEREALPPAALEAHRLRGELGWRALVKRLLLLHGSKLVALLALGAAMQQPGAIGLLLAGGLVLLAPQLGEPAPGATRQQPLLLAGLTGTAMLATTWMVAQYALCLPWMQDLLLRLSPDALDFAQWAGLRLPSPPDPGGGGSSVAAQLEALLRTKALLLVAIALRLRAFRWQDKLPQEVRAAGRCGAPCPLFWPQSPDYTVPPAPHSPAVPGQRRLGPLSLVGSLREAAAVLLSRAQHVTQQALRAVDWPAEPSAEPAERPGASTAAAHGEQSSPPGSPAEPEAAVARQRQWRLLRFALQDWLERIWQEWCLDICLLLLLLAAFSAANALSLVCVAVVGAGMWLPARTTQAMFRWGVVPLLGALALFQYAVLIGLPPTLHRLAAMADDVKDWLGIGHVHPPALWLLFLSFGASTLLVHFYEWQRCAARCSQRQQRQAAAAAAGEADAEAGQLSRASSFDGIESPRLTPAGSYASPPVGQEQRQQLLRAPAQGHTTLEVSTSSADLLDSGPGPAPGLWQPLTLEAQPRWGWIDWARYAVYRQALHYLDALLVAVVGLSALENDAVHAVYLATALFLFRSRIALRARRNSLFWWLPMLNFCVMAVTLAYQAPLQRLLPAWRPGGDVKECSLAHLIGLFRLDPGESLLSLGFRGALADVVLWALARIQSHIFDSTTYDRVQRVVAEEEARERAELLAEVAAWKARHAEAALEESRLRGVRRMRLARLKAATSDTSIQQLYAFLGLRGGDGGSTAQPREQTQQQQKQTQQQGGVEEGLEPLPALSEYEREALGSGGAATAEGAAAPQEPVAAAPTAAAAAQAAATVAAEESRRAGGTLLAWLRQRLRRVDRESVLCYCLMVLAFVADASLLMLALPLSAFLYALVSVKPSKRYFQVVLVYTEALVVTQFAFMVPRRLHCDFLSPQLQHAAEVLGIHGDPLRAIPLFTAYLAVLFHTYSLAARIAQAGSPGAGAGAVTTAAAAPPADLEAGAAQRRPARGASDAALSQQAYLGEALGSRLSSSLQLVGLRLLEACYSTCEFLLRSCTRSERPPHYILVTVARPGEGGAALAPSSSAELQVLLQHILDGYRRTDIAAARERQEQQRAQALEGEPGGAAGQEEPEGNLLTWESSTAAGTAAQQAPLQAPPTSGAAAVEAAEATAAYPDLSRSGPLQLSLVSVQQPSTIDSGEAGSGKGSGSSSKPGGSVAALFEVVPLRSTPENSSGWCSVPGWPLRSLNPAQTAAATLLRYQAAGPPPAPPAAEEDGESDGGAGGGAALAGEACILGVEHYSRQPADWYVATTACDVAAFVWVAFRFNRVVTSAGSLSDITAQVIPITIILALMALSGLLVADRVALALGSPALKAGLHLGSMALVLAYSLALFWSPLTSAGAQNDLRLLLLLKCASFALGALQLRSGYPPAASFGTNPGRQSVWFMQRCSTPRAMAFQLWLALPFAWELRLLLDWTCTTTTLTLADWFKLEDISQSLYFTTWNRKLRAAKQLGERQPRWLKLLQGALLFFGLVLLLWVPLLLFSSAAPTYVVPRVEAHAVNATLRAAGGAWQGSVAEFALFSGGRRRRQQQFLPGSGSMPGDLAGTYVPPQFQLLCTAEDAGEFWEATPPARQQLLDALLGGEGGGPDLSLSLSWSVQRDLPLASERGGPLCWPGISVPLAPASRRQLAALLRGEASEAQLLRDDDGAGGEAGSAALHPLVWLLRGDLCSSSPLQLRDVPSDAADPIWSAWMACNASLLPSNEPARQAMLQPGASLSSGGSMAQQRRLAATAAQGHVGSSTADWWRLGCWPVNASGDPLLPPAEAQATAECGSGYTGPRLVAVLERVQGGILGATLSRYGVAGLYTVVVLSVGRFLRLSLSNAKARIQFEDLPSTAPVVALVQDIYLARAEGLLAAEERLYWRLIDLYRLPSLLFQMTGPNPAPSRPRH